jgi:hypothetical protein
VYVQSVVYAHRLSVLLRKRHQLIHKS